MTDKELLELAAKAAGYNIGEYTPEVIGKDFVHPEIFYMQDGATVWLNWNPLKDSGAALSLAVKLDFCITQWRHYENAAPHVMVGYSTGPNHGANWFEDYNGDEMAANRRAIVCAAAEVGKAMP